MHSRDGAARQSETRLDVSDEENARLRARSTYAAGGRDRAVLTEGGHHHAGEHWAAEVLASCARAVKDLLSAISKQPAGRTAAADRGLVTVLEASGMQATQALAREAWSEYLDAVSAELVNAPVTIDVMGDPGPPVLEARRRALQALGYDDRDDVFEIAVARRHAAAQRAPPPSRSSEAKRD